jgi:hypothetical protein
VELKTAQQREESGVIAKYDALKEAIIEGKAKYSEPKISKHCPQLQ